MTSITRTTTTFRAPGGIRTPDPRIRSPTLCPAELRAQSLHLQRNGPSPAKPTNDDCPQWGPVRFGGLGVIALQDKGGLDVLRFGPRIAVLAKGFQPGEGVFGGSTTAVISTVLPSSVHGALCHF